MSRDELTSHFSTDTGHQRSASRGALRLPLHVHSRPERFSRRGYVVKGADTAVSLSPHPEDTSLVRSDSLKDHPFFAASFDARWGLNRLLVPEIMADCTILYRYELEFDKTGTSMLIGKTWSTPEAERRIDWIIAKKACQAANKYHDSESKQYDDLLLRDDVRRNPMHLNRRLLGLVHLAAHRSGLALVCGYPPQIFHKANRVRDAAEWIIMIIMQLFDWLHQFDSLAKNATAIERLILQRKHQELMYRAIDRYPYTYLRIANAIGSKELFRRALSMVAYDQVWPRWTQPGGLEPWTKEESLWRLDDMKLSDLQHQLGSDEVLVRDALSARSAVYSSYRKIRAGLALVDSISTLGRVKDAL